MYKNEIEYYKYKEIKLNKGLSNKKSNVILYSVELKKRFVNMRGKGEVL